MGGGEGRGGGAGGGRGGVEGGGKGGGVGRGGGLEGWSLFPNIRFYTALLDYLCGSGGLAALHFFG